VRTPSYLFYYGARYYDPKTSVFLGVDPKADKYPGWSVYAYCMDNPIRLIDPNGMEPGDPGDGKKQQQNPQGPRPNTRDLNPWLPNSPPQQQPNNSPPSASQQSGGYGQTIKDIGDGLSAAGIAAAGTQVYTKVNAPAEIAYTTFSGTARSVSKTNVLTGLHGAGTLLLGVSTLVDVSLSLSVPELQPWGNTILNFGVGLLPAAIGTGPGLAFGVGYTVLDKFGTFDIQTNLTPYTSPLMPCDATYLAPRMVGH